MTDKELMTLIKNDPERGVALAVDLYGGVVKAICNNILRGFNRDEIEEAWSDTFVKLWRNADKFDPKRKASLKTYVGTIARSVALDVRRKSNKTSFAELEEDSMIDLSVNIEDDYAKTQNEKVVHEAVASMDEPDRSIFILRFFYSNTIKDIAEKLALKPKQVENSLFRKKENLKDALIKGGVLND